MPKFVIERNVPGAGAMNAVEKQGAAATSNSALEELGEQIQWVRSYITQNRIYCIYIAPSQELIEARAQPSGFPADKVSEVKVPVDPTTAGA